MLKTSPQKIAQQAIQNGFIPKFLKMPTWHQELERYSLNTLDQNLEQKNLEQDQVQQNTMSILLDPSLEAQNWISQYVESLAKELSELCKSTSSIENIQTPLNQFINALHPLSKEHQIQGIKSFKEYIKYSPFIQNETLNKKIDQIMVNHFNVLDHQENHLFSEIAKEEETKFKIFKEELKQLQSEIESEIESDEIFINSIRMNENKNNMSNHLEPIKTPSSHAIIENLKQNLQNRRDHQQNNAQPKIMPKTI